MKRILPIFIILTLLLTSCGAAEKSDKAEVYTSFYAMNELAKAIGGDMAEVTSVVPVGEEPHEFEPTAADIARISKADLFIYHGAGMDDWAKDVAETLPESVTVVCASEGIEQSGSDPHLWLSIKNAEKEYATICKYFSDDEVAENGYINSITNDVVNKDSYLQRLIELWTALDALDEEYKAAGFDGKKLFVTHGAYGYLCDDYGMEQVALEGIAGDSDPSPAKMAQFVDEIKSSGARAVFYDPLEGDTLAKAAASEAGVEALELYTFEGDTGGRDYVTIMQLNLEQLKKGLN